MAVIPNESESSSPSAQAFLARPGPALVRLVISMWHPSRTADFVRRRQRDESLRTTQERGRIADVEPSAVDGVAGQQQPVFVSCTCDRGL